MKGRADMLAIYADITRTVSDHKSSFLGNVLVLQWLGSRVAECYVTTFAVNSVS